MLSDLRFGLKLLWKEKAFTATALLTLALCIGANTAIFTVLNAVVLDPLPFPEPDRLASLYNIYPGVGVTENGANAVPDYLDRRQMTDVFDSVALIGDRGYDVGSQGSPVHIQGQYVTPEFFHVLRASPMVGRAFTPDDAVFQKDKYVILSYGLWKELFGGDRNAVGRDIRLSGVPFRVVGVMPETFEVPGTEARLWVPFAFDPKQTTDDARHNNSWGMIARLKPGISLKYAQTRLDALNRQNIERFPKYRELLINARFGTVIAGLKDQMVKDIRPTLYLLQAAVIFVLLIGCVNVANLMLVRSNVRMKELAIRFSLGAARWRLSRQLLIESLTLAVMGGALGVFVGFAGVKLLAWLGASELPRGTHIAMNAGVLGFSAAVAVITGLLFGSIPVYHLCRRDLNAVFRQTERTGTTERRALWTRSALVVCQVALAFVLLIGSGLLTLSFARVLAVSPGFRPDHLFTAGIALPRSRYAEDAQIRGFTASVMNSIRALPGVTQAGSTNLLPFSNDDNASVITIEGYTLARGENPPVPTWFHTDAGYLRTMGIPLIQGRWFEDTDTPDTRKVVVIDQFLARKYWPKGDALGGQLYRGMKGEPTSELCTVIGVVGTVKTGDLAEHRSVGQIYFDYQQFPGAGRSLYLAVKSRQDSGQLTTAIRAAILRADSELPIFDVKSMDQRLSASLRNRKAAMAICLLFAGLALVLSALGIYGVLAYTVTQRTREFGIRLAMGATTRELVGMVLGQGVRLAAIGLAIGVIGAVLLTRLMTTLLYGVTPGDPLVFVAVAASLLAVAGIASAIPSLRAVRIHPAVALRYE